MMRELAVIICSGMLLASCSGGSSGRQSQSQAGGPPMMACDAWDGQRMSEEECRAIESARRLLKQRTDGRRPPSSKPYNPYPAGE